MAEKVTVWKLENRDFPGEFLAVAENELDALVDTVRYAEDGDAFTVTIEKWDKKDLDNLPEWDGW